MLSTLILTPIGAAHATIDEPTRLVNPVIGDNTDVVITSLGAGETIRGFQPPTPITQDPTAPYPETDPSGYEPKSTYAGTIIASSVSEPGLSAPMYCINLRVGTEVGIGYENGTWEESAVPNIGYVTYILNAYYPTTDLPAGLTEDQQAAAVQAAIWYFTDGFVVNTNVPTIRAEAAAIVAAAQANGPVVEPPAPEVSITPPAVEAPVGSPAGPFLVEAENAADVTVSVPEGYSIFADEGATVPVPSGSSVPSGTELWVTSPSTTADETVLTARAVVTVQRGQVYLYDGNRTDRTDAQRLILADTAELDATAQATASFFEAGTLTVTKSFAGAGAGLQGPIQLIVDCGEPFVYTADIPAGADTDQVFTYTDLPVDLMCQVSEPTTGANTQVDVTTDAPQEAVITAAGSSVTVTNQVSLRPGALNVTKLIAGAAAGQQGEITVLVDCGDVLDDTITIPAGTAAGEYVQSYTDLPAGTECAVTETATGATATVDVVTGDPVTVTIEAGATAEAAITNTYTAHAPAPGPGPSGDGSGAGRLPVSGAAAVEPLVGAAGLMFLLGTLSVLIASRRRVTS